MTKPKTAKIAFDLLSADELMGHISGAAMPEVVARMTQESPTNIRRWMDKGFPSEARLEAFMDALPEETRTHIQAIKDGDIAYPSPLGSYLYPALEEDWALHEATLARLHRAAYIDLRARSSVERYPLQSLLQCLWGIPLSDEGKSPAKELTPPSEIPIELLEELNQDRATMVRMTFFSTLASLDLELCRRIYPENEPRMIFLTVTPNIRKRKGLPPHIVTPERRLADLLYCSVVGADYPPRLEDMLQLDSERRLLPEWRAIAQLKDRFKDGAVEWPDFNRLLNAWTTLIPQEEGPFDRSSPSEWAILNLEKSACDLFRLLFVAMKAFSFAFRRAPGKKTNTQLETFRSTYIAAWHGRVRFHGIELKGETSWDKTRMERLINSAQENGAAS